MSLKFIKVIDRTTEPDKIGQYRQVTFAYGAVKRPNNELCLLGGLSHGTCFTFDRDSAIEMVNFLVDNVINK